MGHYFNRASSLTGIHQLALQQGRDLAGSLRVAGISPDALRSPEQRVDFAEICRLMEDCAQDWLMPDLGLRMAAFHSLDILGAVGLVTRMSGTLRGAIEALSDNLIIHNNALIVALEEKDGVAALTIDTIVAPPGQRHFVLMALAVTRNLLQQILNRRFDLIAVTLRQSREGLRPAAEATFRCPVHFDTERNTLYFEAALLDQQIDRSDTAYHAIIERYLFSMRSMLDKSIRDATRGEIARQMEFGKATLGSVAKRLRIEPRNLQRKLKLENTSFRDLMDDWRRERALSLIVQTRLPLSEIALALGYSDQSIFSRAFQRWYGEAPLSYRRRDTTPAANLSGRDGAQPIKASNQYSSPPISDPSNAPLMRMN